ncbi:MAG: YeaH/YhbH family protein, partial [Caldimonas sp.]
FVFHLTKEEFMQIFFDDLALPRMTRSQLVETPEMKSQRAGYSNSGTPSNLSVIRSMRGAIGRRVAIGAGSRAELLALTARLAELPEGSADAAEVLARKELELQIGVLRNRLDRIPYLDPIDLRFRNRVRLPIPTAKAVMFCLMDVSGSMDEARKDLSKRFFILLYLFLTRHYEKIDLVFIRHHTQAQEVDEENFFRARETGGTVVSSALVLMDEIIKERYSNTDWNIYGAQASDGDNWHHDSGRCRELLTESLLPKCRYFAYVQVAEEEQNLWEEYARLQATERSFAMRKVTEASQIYPVFRDLFKSEGVPA